jgi:hypothetical protein
MPASRSRSRPRQSAPNTPLHKLSNSLSDHVPIFNQLSSNVELAAGLLESAQHSLMDNKYVQDWDTMMKDINDVYIPPPSLQRILPHFHSIIALCVSSGMIQSILSVDLVFDYSVALYDTDESKREAFTYYFNILNSNFISLKTLTAMFTVLYGSYMAYSGTTKLDKFAHQGTGLRVVSHFKLIFLLYSLMVMLYLGVIVPKYVQFMLRFHPAGITYDEQMFQGWRLVFATRLVLSGINISIVILALRLLPKLMINLYFRFKKQPGKSGTEVEKDMTMFVDKSADKSAASLEKQSRGRGKKV